MGSMRILWFCVLIHTVFTQSGFGTSYLKKSRLCHQWDCLNTKLGLPDALPPRDQYAKLLQSVLPSGPWQETIGPVLDACYGDKPRRYTNTCPGQAMLHCVIDYLIDNCPEESWKKNDACAPLSSLAGFKYMFSQSRYDNLEINLPKERRPSWFLKNYFNKKCCDVPNLFNSTLMSECGFSSMILYHTHPPRTDSVETFNKIQRKSTTDSSHLDKVNIDENSVYNAPQTPNNKEVIKVVTLPNAEENNHMNLDPLECCDMNSFMEPSWRSECDFQMTWSTQERLVIKSEAPAATLPSTTPKPVIMNDVKVVPVSCEKQTCIFRKLNVITENGTVDKDAFSKLLDNFTSGNPEWTKAKARVVTQCLIRPNLEYPGECEINNLLACTLDVLTENCPHTKKEDPCRHTHSRNEITCQISSSKYRPKNRRQFCGLPHIVNHEVMSECGVPAISHMEFVPILPTAKPKMHSWTPSYICKDTTASTKCLMKKMGVMNKYGFMDYFKMKDHIRQFTSDQAWSSLTDVYLSHFSSMPIYKEHCSSPKKLLNVLDAMLTTCPISKRKDSPQCNSLFNEIVNTPLNTAKDSKDDVNRILGHYMHIYLPYAAASVRNSRISHPRSRKPRIHKNPLFDFGLLGSKDAPPVRVIDVKPRVAQKSPVLLPVYLRMAGVGQGSVSIRPYDGNYGTDPFALHKRIAMAHTADASTSKIVA